MALLTRLIVHRVTLRDARSLTRLVSGRPLWVGRLDEVVGRPLIAPGRHRFLKAPVRAWIGRAYPFVPRGRSCRAPPTGRRWRLTPSEACRVRRKANVPWRRCPLQIACQRNADDGSDTATVERVALYDHDRASEPWLGATWLRQVCPPDISLGDRHQSLRLSIRREAVCTKRSAGSPISVSARSMASVTRSGA